MARQRKLSPERKAFINSLPEHYQPSDANDVQEILKDLLGDTLQGMLEAEMDEKLGYSRYDYQNKQTDISNIEEQVLSIYAKGMTTRDISAHLKDVYGVDASAEMISR